MSIFEYDEEQHLKSEREQAYQNGKDEGIRAGRREGIAEGRKEGIKEGLRKGENRLAELLQILSAEGRDDDIRRAIADQMYREQLYQEKHL